jgi:bacteriocin-like protein
MSEPKPIEPASTPCTEKEKNAELTENELKQVSGGDTASPKLYEALHNGTHIQKVIIE